MREFVLRFYLLAHVWLDTAAFTPLAIGIGHALVEVCRSVIPPHAEFGPVLVPVVAIIGIRG